MYVCIYTCRRVNPIVLSRGRRLGRAAPRYFQFRAAVSSLARSDEAIGNSPRRDFQHFQFARGSSLAGRIHTVTGKEPDGHSFPHSLSLSLSFVRPRIEKVRIQMRRNDHGYPGGLLHAPLEDRESLCFPRSEKPFGYIDREGAQNVSALQRFARSSYLSSSLGFSPQDAISSAEVMRCLNRECRFSVSLKIYLDLRFQILFLETLLFVSSFPPCSHEIPSSQ